MTIERYAPRAFLPIMILSFALLVACTKSHEIADGADGGGNGDASVAGVCADVDCNIGGVCTSEGGTAACTCGDGYHAAGPTTCIADTCEPTAETCNGIDEDCDGAVDNGACTACSCDRWAGAYGTLELANGQRTDSYRHRKSEVSFDGNSAIAFLYSVEETRVSTEIFLELRSPDGVAIGAARSLAFAPDILGGPVDPSQNAISGPIAYGNGRFVATWATGFIEPGAGVIWAAVFTPDAAMVVDSVALDLGGSGASMVGLAVVGDTSYLVYLRAGDMFVQRFDATLSPVGAAIAVPGLYAAGLGLDVRAVGNAVAITGATEPGTTIRTVLVRGGAVVGAADLAQVSATANAEVKASVATDGSDDALVCYTDIGDSLSCRHIRLSDASVNGAAFRVALDSASRAMELLSVGCGYQLVVGLATGSGAQSVYRSFEIDANDTVVRNAVDRRWVQSNQTFAAFRTNAGGLLRVLEARQIAVHSCAPALPEPDCAQLEADMLAAACGPCNGDPNACAVTTAGGQKGTLKENYTHYQTCDSMDAVACRVAMDTPQQCNAAGAWMIPADCALRE